MELRESYEQRPYLSLPYYESSLRQLEFKALQRGLLRASRGNYRILEIGCASGGNLIPMAYEFPEHQFVGLDFSSVQIAEAKRLSMQLKLANIEWKESDFHSLNDREDSFDFVIAHGVFSWIPKDSQVDLLNVVKKKLSTDGLAYVSFNTYPGWHQKDLLRGMLLENLQDGSSLEQAIRRVETTLIHWRHQDLPGTRLLEHELKQALEKDPSHLWHDHLELHNHPLYFSEFVQKVEASGLRVVGDASSRENLDFFASETLKRDLELNPRSKVERECLEDLVRNRAFRRSLLARTEAELSAPGIEFFRDYWLFSTLEKTSVAPDGADIYSAPQLGSIRIHNSKMKELFECLTQNQPRAFRIDELFREMKMDRPEDQTRTLEQLIRYSDFNFVRLYKEEPRWTWKISERPTASRLARIQTMQSNTVTNLRHESLLLDASAIKTLQLLDGAHTLNELKKNFDETQSNLNQWMSILEQMRRHALLQS